MQGKRGRKACLGCRAPLCGRSWRSKIALDEHLTESVHFFFFFSFFKFYPLLVDQPSPQTSVLMLWVTTSFMVTERMRLSLWYKAARSMGSSRSCCCTVL